MSWYYSPLDHRKQSILKAVVVDYVKTAEPVGSKTLLDRHTLGVKSATIRNEMADLADLGYLRQPHTSAGRIPSDMGYRYFVNRLMDIDALPSSVESSARKKLSHFQSEVDLVIEHTCRMLADISRYMGVATHPAVRDAAISHVTVSGVAPKKLLVVLLLDNGRVLHGLVDFDWQSRNVDQEHATNYISERLRGLRLDTLADDSSGDADSPDEEAMNDLLKLVRELAGNEMGASAETEVHFEGAGYILRQPEFRDVERLEAFMSVFEEKRAVHRMLAVAENASDTTVVIGSEIPVGGMRDCSVVATRYRVGGRGSGVIGIVGPTRMDYGRAVSSVRMMSDVLGDLLTGLAL